MFTPPLNTGILGFWTMIYNQGFEVVLHGKKIFGFSHFEIQHQQFIVSYCNVTNGWAHNIDQSDWACFRAQQTEPKHPHIGVINEYEIDDLETNSSREKYKPDQRFVDGTCLQTYMFTDNRFA